MAGKTWVLIDQRHHVYQPHLVLRPHDVGGTARGYSVRKSVLSAGLSAGVDVVEVDNGAFRFTVLPNRGMGLWKAWLGALEIGWHSPIQGPVHPAFVPVEEPSGLGWLDGFDELLVRCGLESNGAPEHDPRGVLRYPLHGRIANLPANYLETSIDDETGEIRLSGEVKEARFLFRNLRLRSTIVTQVGQPGLRIEDEVMNEAGTPAEIQLLYHINIGQPLLGAGSRVVAPLKTLAPRDSRAAAEISTWDLYAPEQAGFAEQVYFTQLAANSAGETQVLLKNAHGSQGLSLRYPVQQLPYFVLWKNTGANVDGYVTGLEPATNLPNQRLLRGGARARDQACAGRKREVRTTTHGLPRHGCRGPGRSRRRGNAARHYAQNPRNPAARLDPGA